MLRAARRTPVRIEEGPTSAVRPKRPMQRDMPLTLRAQASSTALTSVLSTSFRNTLATCAAARHPRHLPPPYAASKPPATLPAILLVISPSHRLRVLASGTAQPPRHGQRLTPKATTQRPGFCMEILQAEYNTAT